MALLTPPDLASAPAMSDLDIVTRVRAGERGLFEIVMRRHNQRLYRAARAIVHDEAEVEDVLQQAYLNAFAHLDQFEARSQLSTWLTRIVINEAMARRRQALRVRTESGGPDGASWAEDPLERLPASQPDPEHQAYAGELQRVLEDAVDGLPEAYRVVFMLRDVEGLSTSETGAGLGLGDEAVKTRLHRARAMIRRAVSARLGRAASRAFQFHASRCDRIVAGVLGALDQAS